MSVSDNLEAIKLSEIEAEQDITSTNACDVTTKSEDSSGKQMHQVYEKLMYEVALGDTMGLVETERYANIDGSDDICEDTSESTGENGSYCITQ